MGFEVFSRSTAPRPSVPMVTVQKRGLISLNRGAYELIGSPEAVELLWDAELKLVGIRPTDPKGVNAYPARAQSKAGDKGPVLVAGQLFTRYIGLDTTDARRWKPEVRDGILCIDLNDPGQLVVSNRNRNKDQPAETVSAE